MSATAQAVVRRACPGALRPMASGDGLIVQTVRQVEERQPRDEDMAWMRGLMKEIAEPSGGG